MGWQRYLHAWMESRWRFLGLEEHSSCDKQFGVAVSR